MNSPDSYSEEHYDTLDDQGLFDAATIRQITGYETDGLHKDFTAEAIASRAGNVAIESFQKSAGTEAPAHIQNNQKGGLNHVAYARRSPEQILIDERGVMLARNLTRKNRG